MHKLTVPLWATAITSLSVSRTVFAQNSKVVPCYSGAGNSSTCDICDESKAIQVAAWDNATWVKNFTLPQSPADSGNGYKVHWKIGQPEEGCRILLLDSFNSDKGSVDARLTGRIGISVSRGGCYASRVGSGGVGVGACCWDECEQIGAKPGANQAEPPKIKLKSRDKDRALQSDSERQTDEETHSPYAVRSRYGRRQRMTTNQNKNPFGDPPPAPAPKWNCKGERIGKGYTKSGKQVVDPNSYPCTGEGCSLTHDFSVSVASSISSEESTTFTNSEGETQNINTGFQWIGPTVTYDHGWTKDFSEAVATSTGTSTSNTKSKSVSFTQQLTIGYEYNGWFAPHMDCQVWKMTCDKGESEVEACNPKLDQDGAPAGVSGVMLTGLA